jgi:hypothetical protein
VSERPRRCRGDGGAYIVMYALLAVVLFTMAAIVLDLAALRQGRRADRAAADLAVTAAATVLAPLRPSTYAQACRAAWDYVLENRDDATGAETPPDCATSFPAVTCDPTTPVTAVGTAGPLTVSITYPVPDGDPLMLAEVQSGDQAQAIDPAVDGAACQRIAVRIERERTFLFGGIAGTPSGRTDVHAVARAEVQTGPVIPAVVALDPSGCDALAVSGAGGQLQIDPAAGGLAIVDSDASGCAAGATITAPPPSSLTAGVTGSIRSYALSGAGFPRAWSGNVVPAPSPALEPTGRAFLDLRYDCGPPCGQPAGQLSQLRATLGGPGAPAGFATYLGPCVVAAMDPPVVVPGDVYVPCPVFQVEGAASFLGARTVFAGDVSVGATACFAVNDSSCGAVGAPAQDAVVYLQGGGTLSKADRGDVVLTRTFVYAGGTLIVPVADQFGTSRLSWTAPLGGDFEDLLFWSDSALPARVGEQQTMAVEGTIATPNATIVLASKHLAGLSQPLQVVAQRVHVDDTGVVVLNPGAGRATGLVARLVKLLR